MILLIRHFIPNIVDFNYLHIDVRFLFQETYSDVVSDFSIAKSK